MLNKKLPQLGKDLDRAIEEGYFVLSPCSFKKRKGCAYPIFLQEYFKEIFEKDGRVKDDVNPHFILELRTLCYLFYKLEEPFTDEQVIEACNKFIVTDDSVKTDFTEWQFSLLRKTVAECLPDDPFDIRPRHSSGATADKHSNLEKRLVRRYIPKLMSVYGLDYFFNTKYHAETWYARNGITVSQPNARFALVPKDARGPRGICIEPHENMFVQQGGMHKIYTFLENYSIHRGRINFTDQTINQRLAYESSMSRKYATIDLKDASDMVSWELVKNVFPHDWVVALEATRSAKVDMPTGITVTLKKFAPMGSAYCFPVEAILFYSICKTVTNEVWVYGDDIIVPTDKVGEVMDLLESYGLIVNKEKSLHKGFFRESCGGDFYKGYNITPIRCKSVELESLYAFANLLSQKFGNSTGEAVINWYESIASVNALRLPTQYANTGVLAFFTDYNPNHFVISKGRWNNDLQRFEFRCLSRKPRIKKRPKLDCEYDLLFDYFTSSEKSIAPIEEHNLHILTRDWVYNQQRNSGKRLQDFIDSDPLYGSTSSTYTDIDSNIGYVWVPLQAV